MRIRGTVRPARLVNRGPSNTIVDVGPESYGLFTNAQIGGLGTMVPVSGGQTITMFVQGAPPSDSMFRWRLWYKGSPFPTWPPPSPSAYAWGECLVAMLHTQTGYTWITYASADIEIKRYILESMTVGDWCAWADANILTHGTPSDLRAPLGTLASRLANCPNLLAALQAKTPVKICMMGDSFQALTGAFPAPLLRRSYPGMDVQITNASLGSHGAEQWVAEGQTVINNSLRPFAPDVVAFGGISSTWANDTAWLTVVDMIRVALPSCEIILASDAEGAGGTATNTSAIVASAAAAKGCAFYDAAAVLDTWVADSGWNIASWKTDGTHFDPRGGLVLGRGWAWFLGAHA